MLAARNNQPVIIAHPDFKLPQRDLNNNGRMCCESLSLNFQNFLQILRPLVLCKVERYFPQSSKYFESY
jgi:hypothetical protein